MSILVKGVPMPKCCGECSAIRCFLLDELTDEEIESKRHEKCPLVEVPEPHGRLIDAEVLTKNLVKRWNVSDDQDFCNKEVWHGIAEAPTVIEAEDGKDS